MSILQEGTLYPMNPPTSVFFLLLLSSILLFGVNTPAAAVSDSYVSLTERYQRALSIDAHNPTLQYQLGVALLVEGKAGEAITKFQVAYPAYIDSVEMNYNLGLAYLKVNDPDSSVLYFEQAETLGALDHPGRYPLEDAYFNLGLTYLNSNLHFEAEQLLNKVLSLNPDRIEVHHALGKLYTLTAEADKAIAEYELYLVAKPNDQAVRDFLFASHYNSGLEQLGQNDYPSARESFAKALKLSPGDTRVRYTLAHTELLQGNPETAIDQLNSIYPQAGKDIRQNIRIVMFNSALALMQRNQDGDLIKAGQAVRTLLAETPEDQKILFLAGNIFLAQKRYDRARESYETLLDIDPGHEGALLNLSIARKGAVKELVAEGRDHLQKKQYLAAVTTLETALSIDPAVPDAASLAAQARQELEIETTGFFDQAEQALAVNKATLALEFTRKGLNNRSEDSRGRKLENKALEFLNAEIEENLRLGNSYLQQGNLDQARTAFNRALELDAGNSSASQGLEQIDQQSHALVKTIVKEAEQALANGDLLRAESAYRKALAQEPEQTEATAGLTRTVSQIERTIASALRQSERAARSGDFDTARQLLNKALNLRQTPEIEQRLTGLDSELKKQITKLISDAERLTEEKNFSAAEDTYQQVLLQAPQHTGAKQGLVGVKRARSTAVDSYLQKAGTALKEEDAGTALTHYRNALQLEPANSAALNGIQEGKRLAARSLSQLKEKANRALHENRFSAAEAGFRKVLELDPYHAEAVAALDRIDKTRQSGIEAGDEQKLYLAGIQLYTKGRYLDAIATWQKVLLLDPAHEKAQMNIDKSQRKLRMIEERKK